MLGRINQNIGAMQAYRNYSVIQNNINTSIRRFSSGFRIAGSIDDASGLAISERFRSRIMGYQMANKNAQDASNMLQVADGSLAETHNVLQRMRQLSIQAAQLTTQPESSTGSASSNNSGIVSVTANGNILTSKNYNVDVTQLATTGGIRTAVTGLATKIDPNVRLDNAGFYTIPSSGQLTVNGGSFNYNVTSTTLNGLLATISSDPYSYVSASYSAATDKVTIAVKNGTDGIQGHIQLNTRMDQSGFGDAPTSTNGKIRINGVDTLYDSSVNTFNQFMANITASDSYVTATYADDKLTLALKTGTDGQQGHTNTGVVMKSGGFSARPTGGAGTLKINNKNIAYNTNTQSLTTILANITASAAGVTATYNPGDDTVTFTSASSIDIDNDTGDLLDALQMSRGNNKGKNYTGGFMGMSGISISSQSTSEIRQAVNISSGNYGANCTSSSEMGTYNISVDDTSNLLSNLRLSGSGMTLVSSSPLGGPVKTNVDITATSPVSGKSLAGLHTAVTTGFFTINNVRFTVEAGSTIDGIISTINSARAGVTASWDAVNEKFVLTNESTGAIDINIGGGGDTSNFINVFFPSGSEVTTVGQNSQFTIDGASYTRTSNIVDDAIDGAILALNNTGAGALVSISSSSMSKDTEISLNAIKAEIAHLNNEMDKIAYSTQYNGRNLLDGTMGGTKKYTNAQMMYLPSSFINSNATSVGGDFAEDYTFDIRFVANGSGGVNGDIYAKKYGEKAYLVQTLKNLDLGSGSFNNLPTFEKNDILNWSGIISALKNRNNGPTDYTYSTMLNHFYNNLSGAGQTIINNWSSGDPSDTDQTTLIDDFNNIVNNNAFYDATVFEPEGEIIFSDEGRNLAQNFASLSDIQKHRLNRLAIERLIFSDDMTHSTLAEGFDGIKLSVNKVTLADIGKSVILQVKGKQDASTVSNVASFCIGASGESINIGLEDMSSIGLGTCLMDYSNNLSIQESIGRLDNAITAVSTQRANIGAIQKRIESKINSNELNILNQQAAESQIRDVDIAQETLSFTRNKILSSASMAVIAQANTAPQLLLSLLR